jgi:hypothetical protein
MSAFRALDREGFRSPGAAKERKGTAGKKAEVWYANETFVKVAFRAWDREGFRSAGSSKRVGK